MGSYSRTAYFAIIKETTEATAVKPNVFIPLISEDIVTEWGAIAAQPVANNRSLNLRLVDTAIPAPTGTVTIQVEPRNIGHFLYGVFGSVSTGRYMPITSASGDFTVGETITGGTSLKTATVVISSKERDYILVSSPSGTFTNAETLTGGTSAKTATLTSYDTAMYGHEFVAPSTTLPTYTIEFGFDNEAYRYTGVRFNAITFNQTDNILTAEVSVTARYEFKMAYVNAATTSGAGSKLISVDQTMGLAAGDTVKIYRPSTSSFIDFVSASVKTHTIDSIGSADTYFAVTNLQTSTVIGDLVVLAPQTPSYAVGNELAWIGQSVVTLDTTIDNVITNATTESIEDAEITLTNALEPRHAANAIKLKDRFPATTFLAGLTGAGSLTRTYTDMEFLDKLRMSRKFAARILTTGATMPTATSYNFKLDWRVPKAHHTAFNPSIGNDDLLNQEMPFDMFYDSTDAYFLKALLVNENTAY